MKLSLAHIAKIISATGQFDDSSIVQGYSIDSRTLRAGELFFAVRGERLNGHDFVEQALASGAATAVVEQNQASRYPEKFRSNLLAVPDTLTALQHLATEVRRLWGKKLIGVTGSAGKTTTKEAIAHVLSSKHRVHKTEGNLNNHFGLPLMLLKLEPEHDLAVVEMGMSHSGEIAALAKIAQPEIGVITNIAPVHLEFFDSVAGIARAKWELIESLPKHGIAILNADDENLARLARSFSGKIVRYGLNAAADVRAENIQAAGTSGFVFDVRANGRSAAARLPLIGAHNIHNVLAAIAVSLACGLELAQAARALATLAPAEKRGQVIQVGNITVINDCYNSNPKALDAMVNALSALPAKRRIVVAGEMLELGPSGEEMHRAAGQHMADQKIDFLLGVRGLAQHIVNSARQAGMRAEFVPAAEEAGEWLAANARDGDAVLLKASRGVKLERALEVWQARSSSAPASTAKTSHGG